MPLLPQFQNNDATFQMFQNKWAAILNPVITNSPNNSIVLKNVVLASGDNVVNHKLGRVLTGWQIVRKRAAADVYDKQDSNTMPALTLILNASAPVTVDLEVF